MKENGQVPEELDRINENLDRSLSEHVYEKSLKTAREAWYELPINRELTTIVASSLGVALIVLWYLTEGEHG